MSSHHIVRDEQEPALVIFNSPSNFDLIQSLLEWSPTVIINPSLVDFVLSNGFKVDVVIGEAQFLSEIRDKLSHQLPIKYISKQSGEHDIQQALYFLIAANYTAANLIVPINQVVKGVEEHYLDSLDLVVYDEGFKWHFCKESKFKKWVPKGFKFRLLDEEVSISRHGELISKKLSTNYSTVEITSEGFVELNKNGKGFWLGESV